MTAVDRSLRAAPDVLTAAEVADLQRRAWFDALTGAANRERFLDLVEAALRARTGDVEVGLVYADLDHFKRLNDVGGHAYGDKVLQTVSTRWRSRLRATDVLGRVGGDEFAVLWTGPAGTAADVAERVVSALEDPVSLSAGKAFVGATVGIAVASAELTSAEALLELADAAMYARKREREVARVPRWSVDGAMVVDRLRMVQDLLASDGDPGPSAAALSRLVVDLEDRRADQ